MNGTGVEQMMAGLGIGPALDNGGGSLDVGLVPPEESMMDVVAAPEGVVPPSPYPSTDPAFLDSLFAQVLEAQQMDHENLAGDQQEALAQSAMLQALIQGAPMGPGAGQEAQSVGFDPGVLPVPPQVQ